MTTYIRAWAVRTSHGLDLRTVYPTRRGAIVNWLMAGAQNTNRITIAGHHNDEQIELLWRNRVMLEAAVIEVQIMEKTGG
jgi:hypothetical protein